MKFQNEVHDFLTERIKHATNAYHDELITDENTDYRRGFFAGVLFSFLRMKADIGDMYANTEQPTD